MLLNVIFVHFISIAAAYFDFKNEADYLLLPSDEKSRPVRIPVRNPIRKTSPMISRAAFEEFSPSCEQMMRTSLTPYVAILLLKNSGNFLGMGSIIDKARVLTARRVVENAAFAPHDILALAGRLGPWWGRNSQVKVVDEIFQNDGELALAKLRETFVFNLNVAPIKLPVPKIGPIKNSSFAVFGLPRSSVDVPGDAVPKSSIYFVSIEKPMTNEQECIKELLNVEFNETYNFCTSTNSTYGWGCIGSPTVAIDKDGKVVQVGVITHAAVTERDICHIHTKILPFNQWIRSHSLINYRIPDFDV